MSKRKRATTNSMPRGPVRVPSGLRVGGVGDGPKRAVKSNLPVIREITDPVQVDFLTKMLQPGTKPYVMGKVRILLSPPYGEQGRIGWHMSISLRDRYPTWDEVTGAWYTLVPDAATRLAVMILPPRADYVNIHDYCFQVHEMLDGVVAGYVLENGRIK